jgi:methionyl aminopeptidase
MPQKQKTPSEIQAMRDCGRILATIFRDLKAYVKPGMTERQVDAWVDEQIKAHGAVATYKTAEVGFDGAICISVDDAITHGLPSDYVLQQGDVVGFDLVIAYQGMKTDSAFTMVLGEAPTGAVKHLLSTTERALFAGIDAIKGPTRVGDISAAVEKVLSQGKVGIIRELVGHGVGHLMHDEPEVPNYGRAGTGPLLTPGTTIAIEPLTSLGTEKIMVDDDGWTLRTRDGSLAAQFEHTVLITEDGAEVLTML